MEELLKDLETKEIDFHKELLSFYRYTNDSGSKIALAKYFFDLGIKDQIMTSNLHQRI